MKRASGHTCAASIAVGLSVFHGALRDSWDYLVGRGDCFRANATRVAAAKSSCTASLSLTQFACDQERLGGRHTNNCRTKVR